MVLLTIAIIFGLTLIWAVSRYNLLVRLKAHLNEAWSGIDVQLKRRYDLIPNLVETVKGYSVHEKTVFTDIARLRSASMNATTVAEKSTAEAGLTQALKTLFAVAENYPDLKANENFLSLQKELSKIEEELQLARRYYNGTARNYNIIVISFPSNIVANLTGFQTASYFELSSNAEKETPKVNF